MKKKLKVAVLMGGGSSERKISILSGHNVMRNLDKRKYDAFPMVLPRVSTNFNIPKNVDVAFIAMHGPLGEDGTLQGMLEMAGIVYTGSGVLASALGMDKIMFRKLVSCEKIPVPKYLIVKKGEKIVAGLEGLGEAPYFVKPHNQGSSVGVSVARHAKELNKALKLAFKFSDTALVEEYIKGREVTCAVLGNDNPLALPIVEVVLKKDSFFDYKSKYTKGMVEEIVPARISVSLTKKVQEIAVKVHSLLGCKGFSRVDFILRNGGEPVVLEINTIPGLTPQSLVPKAAKAAGYSYGDLLDKIIEFALYGK